MFYFLQLAQLCLLSLSNELQILPRAVHILISCTFILILIRKMITTNKISTSRFDFFNFTFQIGTVYSKITLDLTICKPCQFFLAISIISFNQMLYNILWELGAGRRPEIDNWIFIRTGIVYYKAQLKSISISIMVQAGLILKLLQPPTNPPTRPG